MSESISQLVQMGFSESDARNALLYTSNLEQAVELLLSGSLASPAQGTVDLQVAESGNVNAVLGSHGVVVSGDISQYSQPDGRSACTAIALVAAAQLINQSVKDATSADINRFVLGGVDVYRAVGRMGSADHTSAAEVFASSALLQSKLQYSTAMEIPYQGLVGHEAFTQLLNQVHSIPDSQTRAVVITKPPETILVIVQKEAGRTLFYLLDSHPRPESGLEAAHLLCQLELRSVVEALVSRFPAVDFDGDSSLMAAMYNTFEATVFQRVAEIS